VTLPRRGSSHTFSAEFTRKMDKPALWTSPEIAKLLVEAAIPIALTASGGIASRVGRGAAVLT
jgi:hypothetical protein